MSQQPKGKFTQIIKLINDIRNSHPDMETLYTEGQCYHFALILRGQFPGGELWYDHRVGHMYYHYLGKWFDIRGIHYRPPAGGLYNFLDGDPAYRWGRRDRRTFQLVTR